MMIGHPRTMEEVIAGRGELVSLAAFCSSILPLILFEYTPLMDLPNHLARQQVLHELFAGRGADDFYAFDFVLIPNLGMDLFFQALLPLLPLTLISKLFLVVICALIFFGVRRIERSLDGEGHGLWHCLSPVLFYSGPMQFGFLSYALGLGIALWGFYGFVKLGRNLRPLFLLAMAALAVVLFVVHLSALIVYLVAIGSFATCEVAVAWRSRGWCVALLRMRAWAVAGAHVVPALALVVWPKGPVTDSHSGPHWSLAWKIEALLSPVFFSDHWTEIPIAFLLFALLAVLLLIGTFRFAVPLIAPAGALFFLTLVAPSEALGGAFIDYRLPISAAAFGIAAMRPGTAPADSLRRGLGSAAVGGLVALMGTRILLLALNWHQWQPIYRSFVAAAERMPVGSPYLTIEGITPSTSQGRHPPISHAPSYAVIDRQARSGSLFADLPSHQLLRIKPNNGVPIGVQAATSFDLDSMSYYQFVFVIHPRHIEIRGDRRRTVVYETSHFALYDLR